MAATWSYDAVQSTDKDKVRGMIGDIDTNDQQFTDAAITARLASEGSVYGAAIKLVNELISKYSRKVNKSLGKISVQASDIVKHYRSLLFDLQTQSIGSSTMTGTFIDEDREPVFTRDMQENDENSPNADDGDGDE